MTKRFRLLLTLIIVVGCCTLLGYVLYRMGDSGSTSTNAPASEAKTTRQKNLDWLKAIQGIRDEPVTTTTKSIHATTTIDIATSTDMTTSTTDLIQGTSTTTDDMIVPTSTRKQRPRGTNQR